MRQNRQEQTHNVPSISSGENFYMTCFFTSMFVERMEVLECRQKFEVELSTFLDSTNTETRRKLVFSLTCVCVCVRDVRFPIRSREIDLSGPIFRSFESILGASDSYQIDSFHAIFDTIIELCDQRLL